MKQKFFPQWAALPSAEPMGAWSDEAIKNEPMLFSCDIAYAGKHGGPLTRGFLDRLASTGIGKRDDWIIDSRVHMLKTGWWPCIPGWHIDDFHRGGDGQPDLASLSADLGHVMAIVGNYSRTEFLDGEVELTDPPAGVVKYGWYNNQIRKLVAGQFVAPVPVEPGRLYWFGGSDFHRGTPATKDGWRWFIRATSGSDRKPVNEIRRQVQVYLAIPDEGW